MDGQQQRSAAITVLSMGRRRRDSQSDPRALAATAALAGACCAAAHPAMIADDPAAVTATLLAAGLAAGAIWAAAMGLFAWALTGRDPAPRGGMALAGAWAMLGAGIAVDVPGASSPALLLCGALFGVVYDRTARHAPRRASGLILPFAPPRPGDATPDQAASTATSALSP